MKIIKISVPIILCLLLYSFRPSFACQCPPLEPVTKELSNKYDVIFYGKVDSVSPCATDGISTVHFTIKELYKGNAEQQVKIDFDCKTDCMMSFIKDEEWIIYSIFQKFDLLTVTICEHSRKYFPENSQDVYQAAALRTFEQEKEFLRTALGIQPFITENKLNEQQKSFGHHNTQPSVSNKILLLTISLLTMGIVYFVIQFRNKKRNDK